MSSLLVLISHLCFLFSESHFPGIISLSAQVIMDVDFWTSRTRSVKHLSTPSANAHQAARFGYVNDNCSVLHNSQGDEDTRAYFPCPFCYVEIELSAFCNHLQEEHCFDLKNAVCPLCAANLGKNPIEHFSLQHAHSIKQRQKPQRSGFWTNNPAGVGKELHGFSSFLGSRSKIDKGNSKESAPDPFLSLFFGITPLSNSSGSAKEEHLIEKVSTVSEVERTMLSDHHEERKQRSEFVQELMMSTIYEDT